MLSAPSDLSQSGLTEITGRPFSFTTSTRQGGDKTRCKLQLLQMPRGARHITTTRVPEEKEMDDEERACDYIIQILDIYLNFRMYCSLFETFQWVSTDKGWKGKRLFPTVMEMDPPSHMSQPLLVFWAYAKWKPALLPATVNKTERKLPPIWN